MAAVRTRGTKPEMVVRSILHRLGYRYRLHRADLPGKPDIVLAKHRTVILVHGCFWHRHRRCAFAYVPKSREEFWHKKLEGNADRDRRVRKALRRMGWRVITVWECETRRPVGLPEKLDSALRALGTNADTA